MLHALGFGQRIEREHGHLENEDRVFAFLVRGLVGARRKPARERLVDAISRADDQSAFEAGVAR
jgi:hypothetical protein